VVAGGRVVLAFLEAQFLEHLTEAIDIALGTGDSSADFGRNELAFGYFPRDISLTVFWYFHGKHKLPEREMKFFL
jgi:hypothetical protein